MANFLGVFAQTFVVSTGNLKLKVFVEGDISFIEARWQPFTRTNRSLQSPFLIAEMVYYLKFLSGHFTSRENITYFVLAHFFKNSFVQLSLASINQQVVALCEKSNSLRTSVHFLTKLTFSDKICLFAQDLFPDAKNTIDH